MGDRKRDLWGDAYRELLRPRSVAVTLASVILFVVAMTIFGPLGTLETLRPLPRFAYWAVSAAITFPFCYAVAAVTLYLTRRISLLGIVPAVAAGVLLEGFICMVVVVSAHLVFIPHVPPPDPVNTYLTVTVVVAVCTFFAHYVVFLRTSHGRTVVPERSDEAAPPVRHDAVVAGRGSETVPASVTVEVGTTAPGAGAFSLIARPAPQSRAHVPGPRGSEPGRLTAQQARFYRRLSRTVSRDIVYLRVDDHYVQVSSTDGSCLILMRFADAVVELGDLGMQVHRSYRDVLAEALIRQGDGICSPDALTIGDDAVLIHRVTGSPGHRVTGSPGHRVTGSPGHRSCGRVPVMSGSARGHRPGCASSPPESSRSAAGCRRAAALLFLPLLPLSFLSLAPQVSAAEVQTNCPGPRTGDKKFDPDQWPYPRTPTYEKDNIYGVGCLDVMVSEAYKVSAAKASEGSSKHYAFRVTSKIAPGPWGIPHTQYFEYNIKLGGTAKKGEDYEFFRSGPSSHLPGRGYGFLFDSSKTWVLQDTPPGFVTAAFVFRILDDDEVEPDETVTFTISYRKPGGGGAAEYQIGTATATFTIQNDDVPPTPQRPRISIAPKTSSITEGASASFTLTATPAPAAPVQVGVTVATNGDYGITAAKRTVTIPTTGSYELTLATTDDDADEADGSVTATLNAGDGYTVGRKASSGKVAIADDDAPPEPAVTIAAGTSPVTEGGTATFTLTATPAPTADLAVSVTVAAAGDYGITAGPRTVTIPTTGSAMLTLTTVGDDADEADGSVTVTVTDGEGYTVGSSASVTVAIADDDLPPEPAVTIAAGTSPVTEGGAATFTLTATPAPTADLAVSVTVAAAGDYGITAGPRTVTIPTTGSAMLTLTTVGDDADEADGSVTVTVTDGEGYTVGSSASATVAVRDDDLPPPEVTIAAKAGSVTEGGNAVFTLTASPAPAAALPVSVTVATAGDYGISGGTRTVSIPTTGSATLTLATIDDSADEADGSVTATVAAGSGYTVGASASGTVAVRDDDDPAPVVAAVDPALIAEVRTLAGQTHHGTAHVTRWRRVLVAFGVETYPGLTPTTAAEAEANAKKYSSPLWPRIAEALKKLEAAAQQDPPGTPEIAVSAGSAVTEGGDAVFTLTADPAPAADLPVSVTVAATGDYGIASGTRTVTIPTTGSATLTLATTGDDADEPDGSVSVTATDGEGYTVGSSASATVAVRDDDLPPPEVTIAAKAGSVTEGGNAVFTLTASPAPAAALPVSVTVATAGDYGISGGTRTVSIPTTGSATLTLATIDDSADEADGSVTATVAAGSGYTVGASASGTVAVRDDDLPPPEVTIAAKAGSVTEGGNAVFTLTASPAPAAALPVSVTVAATGDYGISSGTQTVTIPTSGSATLTLATMDDGADEPDGSVTATVAAGSGYTVGNPASGTVAVRDDDLPPPVVTIAPKTESVTEGGDAVFTLTADRASDADLTVTLAVSETGDGDHVAASDEGPATVTIPKDATEAAFTLATVNDAVDEPDGTVSVAVTACAGCTAGDPASASVAVKDDDAPSTAPALSVGDSTAKEGGRLPVMPFTVRLSSPAPGPVRVYVSTRPSTPVSAEPWRDYAPGSSDLTFRAGETEKQVWILIYDDSHDEGPETFEVVLSNARGASIGDGVAVGTIVNDDPMPAAWLARFGRTVAEQALDGIAGRLAARRTPGMQGALAGHAVSLSTGSGQAFDPAGFGTVSGSMSEAGFGTPLPLHFRTMTAREALQGSSFSLTGQRDGSGGSMAFWGGAAHGSFDGREGTFSLDGTATTALLGADYARGRWLIGLALAQIDGEGDYRDTKTTPRLPSQACPAVAEGRDAELCRNAVRAGAGEVEASLTAAIPYVALRVSERLKFWGAAGHGTGEVTLKTERGGRYGADTNWSMAAGGLRGDLLAPPAEGSGVALAMTSDALWTRTSSEKTSDLAASEADATRLRIGLEGSYHVALGGGTVTPKLELGARHDGGDAETGFGGEFGGGVKWTDPGLGLSLDVSGRALLAHVDVDLKGWGVSAALAYDPAPATKRGASLNLRQEYGDRAPGGLDALFQPAPLDGRTGSGEATSRWALEAAYGFPAFGGSWTGSPHAGLVLATGSRDYSVGWRLTPEAASAPDLAFGVKATRRENDTQAAEHTFGIELRAAW